MMVPAAYRYSSSPPKSTVDERRSAKRSVAPKVERRSPARPASPARNSTEPVKTASKPVAVPTPQRSQSGDVQTMPTRTRKAPVRIARTPSGAHDPNALPPAVAALLAVTAIPPRHFRKKSRDQRRISIDELVNDWKSDDISKASFSSSPALSVLLENLDDGEEQEVAASVSLIEEHLLHTRSTSSDSVPSLEADNQSVLSMGSPGTPESLRSRKSSSNLRRERARSSIATEDSSLDHPLVPQTPSVEDEGLVLSAPIVRTARPKPKSSFTSNLTTSLRALTTATISSFASFSLTTATAPSQRTSVPQFSDEMLWSHPFLFPHYSSEVRPAITGTPTQAQRRYLNPMPLTFEEQEAPFQQALHAPYLAERVDDIVPSIQMQTYNRGKRKASASPSRAGPDPNSEAGRALLGETGVRQREPRENSDFLRVVVLEMNMRREGKLESGRARIWLPPRQVSIVVPEVGRVPRRWVGVSAY